VRSFLIANSFKCSPSDFLPAFDLVSRNKRDASDEKSEAASSAAAGSAAGSTFVPKLNKKKAKKKRNIIYPKGYDPTKPNNGLPPIDPERWLPRYERSYYRVKGKNKRNTVGKGSQGGIARSEKDKLVEEKLMAASAPAAAAPAAAASPASSSSKKKGKK
jgi:signal recognition particle subunit SRP72